MPPKGLPLVDGRCSAPKGLPLVDGRCNNPKGSMCPLIGGVGGGGLVVLYGGLTAPPCPPQ